MTEKSLGKLGKVTFGSGGYDNAMTGFTFPLHGEKGSSIDFWGTWSGDRTAGTKWTEESRIKLHGEAVMRMQEILNKAKKNHLHELEGTPIEITWVDGRLATWRVLCEVL